jgi:hypothetical protein
MMVVMSEYVYSWVQDLKTEGIEIALPMIVVVWS